MLNVIDGKGAEKSIRLKIPLKRLGKSQDSKIIISPGIIANTIVKLNKIEALNDLKIKSKEVNNVPMDVGCFLFNDNKILRRPRDNPIRNNSEEK